MPDSGVPSLLQEMVGRGSPDAEQVNVKVSPTNRAGGSEGKEAVGFSVVKGKQKDVDTNRKDISFLKRNRELCIFTINFDVACRGGTSMLVGGCTRVASLITKLNILFGEGVCSARQCSSIFAP